MSAYGAGKMAEGVIGMCFVVLAVVAGLAGLIALGVPFMGPIGTAISAAVIVYLVGAAFTRSLVPTTGLRIGSMIGAAAGGWCGGQVYQHVGGIGGVLLSALATGALVGIGVFVGFLTTSLLIGSSKKKA